MINKLRHVTGCAVTLAITAVFGLPEVFALGFRNPDQDARATGQGEAFVAQADDASAIYYNPGGLTQIQGTEITSGGMVDFPEAHLKRAGSGEQMNDMAFLPHLYISTDFGLTNSPWRAGLGFNVPFGNQADYSHNGRFNYFVTSASLAVFNIEPTVAYKINDHLSIGVGLNIYEATTDLRRQVPPPLGGGSHFYGDGVSLGTTAGLLWKITPQHTVGVVYRSPFTIDFDGNASLNATMIGSPANSAHTSINFPQSVAGGYAFRPIKNLKLEADIEWTNWQPLHSVVLHSPGFPVPGVDGSTIPFHWQDSFFYEFGAQYDIDNHWTVRGGYIYSENTVPNSSFSPTVPDSNRHVFSVGLGYALTKKLNVDVVYQHSYSPDRTVNNDTAVPPANGTWESHGDAVIFTSSVKF